MPSVFLADSDAFFFFLKENAPMEEVFSVLKTSPKGLTNEEAEARLKAFGPNKLEEKSVC